MIFPGLKHISRFLHVWVMPSRTVHFMFAVSGIATLLCMGSIQLKFIIAYQFGIFVLQDVISYTHNMFCYLNWLQKVVGTLSQLYEFPAPATFL